jgi:hypothetical protein
MNSGKGRFAVVFASAALLCVTSGAFGAARLSHAQFKAIDGLYIAYVPVEANQFTASDIASLDHACRALNPADELLGEMRPGCILMVRAARQAGTLNGCSAASSCRKAVRAMRRTWQKLANRQAAENRALNRVLSAGPCRNVLRTSASDINAVDLLISALREIERALTNAGRPDLTASRRLIEKARKATKEFHPPSRTRAKFRKACR